MIRNVEKPIHKEMTMGKRNIRCLTFVFQQMSVDRSLPLPDACVDQSSLIARVAAHQQQQVRLLDARDPSVQQVV